MVIQPLLRISVLAKNPDGLLFEVRIIITVQPEDWTEGQVVDMHIDHRQLGFIMFHTTEMVDLLFSKVRQIKSNTHFMHYCLPMKAKAVPLTWFLINHTQCCYILSVENIDPSVLSTLKGFLTWVFSRLTLMLEARFTRL